MEEEKEIALGHLDSIERKIREAERRNRCISITSAVSVFLVGILLSVYFFFFGSVKISKCQGMRFLSEEQIWDIGKFSSSPYMIFSSPEEKRKNLEANPYIESASVKWSLFSYEVSIREVIPLLSLNGDVLLSNGKFQSAYQNVHPDYHYPSDVHLITSLSPYQSTLLEQHFLHVLSDWNEEEFGKMAYYDISILSLSKPSANDVYFGIYFQVGEDFFRLRANLTTWQILKKKENVLHDILSIQSHLETKTWTDETTSFSYFAISAKTDAASQSVKFYAY